MIMKKSDLRAIILALLLSMSTLLVPMIPIAQAVGSTAQSIVTASIWGPATIDPAWSYDTASATVIMNTHDALIWFKVDREDPDPMTQGKTDQFVPSLATEWVENAPPDPNAPAYTDNTWYFKIRENVPWHDSAYGTVTPADVEYSFERVLVFSRSGGPQWMIYEPLLGAGSGFDPSDPDMGQKIKDAVQSNSTHVWFNLISPYPGVVFKQVWAQGWAAIICQDWAWDHNCWPGPNNPEFTGDPYSNATMMTYHDPSVSPLDDYPTGTGNRVECGCGPYTLTIWDATAHTYSLEWFQDYWNGWPAPGTNQYGYNDEGSYAEGWIKTVTFKGIDEWSTRKSMFLAGDCDFCYVPRENLPEVVTNWGEDPSWEEEEYPAGIECLPGIPSAVNSAFFYTFNVSVTDYLGSAPYDSIHEGGAPTWLFNDTHTGQAGNGTILRHAFAYSFDWETYISAAFLGEAKQPPNPAIEGLAYDEYLWDVVSETDETKAYTNGVPDATVSGADLNPADTADDTLSGGDPWSQPDFPNGTNGIPPNRMHYYDLAKAEEYFKQAWGGDVWANGFTFDILYNTGNTARKIAAEMIRDAVEGLNPKFHINVKAVDWPTYLYGMVLGKLPMFIIGWLADYLDPHNWFHPYMHSAGAFAAWQGYSNPAVDALINSEITETDDNKRIEIFHELGEIYFQDCPGFILVQAMGRHWERDWMEGWYNNPIYPGGYYYHYWKGYGGDVNRDYTVDVFDLVVTAGSYGLSPGDAEWNAVADVNADGTVDVFDLVRVAGEYGRSVP